MVIFKIVKLFPIFFALLILASCSTSDGGDTTGSTATTGRVSLLITDAPSDDFDQINLTVESISFIGGDDGHETIVFAESRVVDLLALQNYSDLIVTAVIPVGSYDKIRLHVSQVELVKFVEGLAPERIITKLPASGKVDLNPRGSFEMVGDGHLMIELDVDAEKSIHIIEKGNGDISYNFRPVVFVNIVGVDDEVKLILLEDKLVSQKTDSGFLLCEDSDGPVQIDADEDHDGCIAMEISDNTVVQDDLIEVTSASNIVDGSVITILGKLSYKKIDALHIVIEAADREVSDLALFSGAATSAFNIDNFTMNASTDDGDVSIQPLSITELVIALVDGSGVRVFDKNGDEVSADAIVAGTNIDVFGLATPDLASVEKVKGAFLIINNDKTSDKLSGAIAGINEAVFEIIVLANLGDTTADVCVDAENAIIFILGFVEGKVVSKEIPLSALHTEMLIDVYGDNNGAACVAANVILVAEPFASTPVEALLVTGN